MSKYLNLNGFSLKKYGHLRAYIIVGESCISCGY